MAAPLAALGTGLGRLVHRLLRAIKALPVAAAGPLQASLLACNLVLLSIGQSLLLAALRLALAVNWAACGRPGAPCRALSSPPISRFNTQATSTGHCTGATARPPTLGVPPAPGPDLACSHAAAKAGPVCSHSAGSAAAGRRELGPAAATPAAALDQGAGQTAGDAAARSLHWCACCGLAASRAAVCLLRWHGFHTLAAASHATGPPALPCPWLPSSMPTGSGGSTCSRSWRWPGPPSTA